MSQTIIQVENLGKSYLVGHQSDRNESYTALRDVLGRAVRNYGRRAFEMVRGCPIVLGDEVEEFWALSDVSFSVNEGEVVGIVGRNGAGKSTLLKVLSRITEPTKGRVTLRGRVASLLEVGTGFHPELTGRENVFLNGSILGMSRTDIRSKFDEIVEFAEVERFLDTPVKRYSSGMYVRLAFAVAAHLEPEVLVVDEVLAVGDVAFQRKCLGKMQDVASNGRTVLIVSHNMPMIKSLCSRVIVLKSGGLCFDGEAEPAIENYLSANNPESGSTATSADSRIGDGSVRFTHAQVTNRGTTNTVQMGTEIRIILGYQCNVDEGISDISIHINDKWGQPVLRLATRESAQDPLVIRQGVGEITCQIEDLRLLPGRYSVLAAISRPPAYEYRDYVENLCVFEVVPNDVFGTGRIPEFGVFFQACEWECNPQGRPPDRLLEINVNNPNE